MILRRILIANRGEIALRIMRTCARLGIETVLAASDADLTSMAAKRADHVVRLGPAQASGSYLNVSAVVAAARAAAVDALHPGYGFLSENAALARACAAAGIVFIGPTPEQLLAVGDKLRARAHAVAAGLPILPGGDVASLDGAAALALAASVGYPVLIKAVGGGGGRGMKQVHSPAGLGEALDRAIAEAGAAFGDPRVYLERYVAAGRHIEVQILGDGQSVVHLGTRDCSIQRRYQKLIEEAPAPSLATEVRECMQAAATSLGRHLAYRGLGTVEFLYDCNRETFYFLEMNARIQVEHPVTEAICGLDLVEQQIRVAEGRPLSFTQEDVRLAGHAIECRINAEDWIRDFRPSPGCVTRAIFAVGEGIRIDTHIEPGAEVPPYYDSLMAKVIAHGSDRTQALERLSGALSSCAIEGVSSTLPLQRALVRSPGFTAGGVTTDYYAQFLENRPAAERID
jgi:acetyl-CoA carboxylase biotin carboxylase subunit